MIGLDEAGNLITANVTAEQEFRPCTCDIARAAYQRGREDAAAALTDYFWPIDGSWITPETSFDVIGNGAIAAARGDGEQA